MIGRNVNGMSYIPKVTQETIDVITAFLEEYIKRICCRGVIIGLSGGIDSALCAKICIDTLGRDKVNLIFLPEGSTSKIDRDDTEKLADHLSIDLMEYSLDSIICEYKKINGSVCKKWLENEDVFTDKKNALINLKPRIRMTILYYLANMRNLLVIGTSNKSELLTGYFTKFGDGGSDLALIGDLYKTQVFQMCRMLDLPEWIFSKKPTAGLVPGVCDEDELKIDYSSLDEILAGLDQGIHPEIISRNCSIPLEEIQRIQRMTFNTIHKRRFPRIPKINLNTVGVDRKEY